MRAQVHALLVEHLFHCFVNWMNVLRHVSRYFPVGFPHTLIVCAIPSHTGTTASLKPQNIIICTWCVSLLFPSWRKTNMISSEKLSKFEYLLHFIYSFRHSLYKYYMLRSHHLLMSILESTQLQSNFNLNFLMVFSSSHRNFSRCIMNIYEDMIVRCSIQWLCFCDAIPLNT